jgi:small-conductance mechanosensitive channel
VMANPEPFVNLDEFGNSTLNFKLFVYVYDVTKGGAVRTDLRIAILEAFHSAGIRMPNGSTDINLRNMDKGRRGMLPIGASARAEHRRRRRGNDGEKAASGNGHGRAGAEA